MWPSNPHVCRLILALSAAAFLLPARTAPAADATVYVYTATLNELASAISPMTITGRYKFTVGSGIFKTTICDSAYTINVTGLSFSISPTSVTADADVTGSWCRVGFNGDLDASGNVYYRASDRTVRFSFSSASVQPYFSVLGYKIWLPVHVNITSTLNIPPMHIGVARVAYETASGPRLVTMVPNDISLVKRSGYLELQSDLAFY
jgi:hypothetical protein